MNTFLKNILKQNVHFSNSKEDWGVVLRFIDIFTVPETDQKGPLALDLFYYGKYGGFENNAQFLFGTPYQHRISHN